MVLLRPLTLSCLALGLAALAPLRADEGMWTFDNLPLQKMRSARGFSPDQAWLDHVRLSSLRFPSGSGSFVSKDGLVLTNHHVAHGFIEQISDKDHDYVKNGFVARSREEEIKVPGLSLVTLMSTENVTDLVEKAVKPGSAEKEADAARTRAMQKLVKEEEAKSGLTCQAVLLYQGGQRWIYRYKKHTDVRLVMAPEYQVAGFGGDWDNFTFPRHDLDFTLFRVYEDGKPFTPSHHLAWSRTGVAAGDLTFTSGHPGRTSRLQTVAQMGFDRDLGLEFQTRMLARDQKAMRAYAAKDGEYARQVSDRLQYDGNFIKVFTGQRQGLQDREAFARVEKAERDLRAKVAADPGLKASAGQSWDRIAKAMADRRKVAKEAALAGTLVGPRGSQLLGQALAIVRLASEAPKPAEQRLQDYASDEALKAAKARVLEARPANAELDAAVLVSALGGLKEELGAEHPLVRALLSGKTPEGLAKGLVEGSRLGDAGVRKSLVEGGAKAVAESHDPMILFAKRLDPLARGLRRQSDAIAAVVSEHGARIAKARFQVYGTAAYPDATFTLRLSYGAVESFPAGGTLVQPFTTLGGLYDRADGWGPKAEEGVWDLPARWREHRGAVNSSTPYNFITTNDIIGGNSGSPVVDAKGELVGLAFDGNMESLPGGYYYDGRVNRMIALDARAIAEVLDKVFEAPDLVKELKGN